MNGVANYSEGLLVGYLKYDARGAHSRRSAKRSRAGEIVDQGLTLLGRRYGVGMVDSRVTEELQKLVAEREWAQFHSVENLAKSIAIEAGELLECFQWGTAASDERVQEELANVLTYCYLLAAKLGEDPDDVVLRKLQVTRAKYPVDKARGRSAKYDEL